MPGKIEKVESNEEKIERLLQLVKSTDLAQFAEENERGLMQRAEQSAIALIRQSEGDPHKFLVQLKSFDPGLKIIEDSAFMEGVKELNGSAGAAFIEKKVIEKLKVITRTIIEHLRSGNIEDLDESLREPVKRFLKSPKGADYYIDKFQAGLSELEGLKTAIVFPAENKENIRLLYHEGIHAVQETVGFYPTKMMKSAIVSEDSKEYMRLKYLLELQDNKILVNAQKEGLIQISERGMLTELGAFKLNLASMEKVLKEDE